jgi:hypothetical protein
MNVVGWEKNLRSPGKRNVEKLTGLFNNDEGEE